MEYRCLHCGQGKHVVAMSCKSSLCLRCAKVAVDNWVSQVSRVLHEGVIYRHIILTVPAMFRTTSYQALTQHSCHQPQTDPLWM
jgi:Transposase zinc-binding domain